jgi:hypothetical protein
MNVQKRIVGCQFQAVKDLQFEYFKELNRKCAQVSKTKALYAHLTAKILAIAISVEPVNAVSYQMLELPTANVKQAKSVKLNHNVFQVRLVHLSNS